MAEPRAKRDITESEDREDDPDVEGRPTEARRHERRVAGDPAAEADEQQEVPREEDEHGPVPYPAARRYAGAVLVRSRLRTRQEERGDERERARAGDDEERSAEVAAGCDEAAESGPQNAARRVRRGDDAVEEREAPLLRGLGDIEARRDHVDPAAEAGNDAVADERDGGGSGRDEKVRGRVGADASDDETARAVAVHEESRGELRDAVRDRKAARHQPELQRRCAE